MTTVRTGHGFRRHSPGRPCGICPGGVYGPGGPPPEPPEPPEEPPADCTGYPTWGPHVIPGDSVQGTAKRVTPWTQNSVDHQRLGGLVGAYLMPGTTSAKNWVAWVEPPYTSIPSGQIVLLDDTGNGGGGTVRVEQSTGDLYVLRSRGTSASPPSTVSFVFSRVPWTGTTWNVGGRTEHVLDTTVDDSGASDPMALERFSDKRLFAIWRRHAIPRQFYYAISSAKGESWPAPTLVPNFPWANANDVEVVKTAMVNDRVVCLFAYRNTTLGQVDLKALIYDNGFSTAISLGAEQAYTGYTVRLLSSLAAVQFGDRNRMGLFRWPLTTPTGLYFERYGVSGSGLSLQVSELVETEANLGGQHYTSLTVGTVPDRWIGVVGKWVSGFPDNPRALILRRNDPSGSWSQLIETSYPINEALSIARQTYCDDSVSFLLQGVSGAWLARRPVP